MDNVTDSFTFWVHGGICEVITTSHLPQARLKKVLEFSLSTYAPIVLMAESIAPGGHYAYLVAHQSNEIDTLRMLQILGRNEQGWSLTDGVLYSPRPSKLHSDVVVEAITSSSTAMLEAS